MKVGCGYPMGPFELLDVVGLDVSLAIQRTLYLEFREAGFAPAPLLEHLVAGRPARPQDRQGVPRVRVKVGSFGGRFRPLRTGPSTVVRTADRR